jgi:hypothetical protein
MAEPIQSRVAAQREICLLAFSCRGYFEDEFHRGDESVLDAPDSVRRLGEWLRGEGLWERLSSEEKALMERPTGEWTNQERLNAGWRIESAGAIAWALSLLPMPPYDKSFRPGHVLDVVPERGQPTEAWIRQARLRREHEILEQRELAESWLWRYRTEQNLRNPNGYGPPPGRTFAQIIARSAKHHQDEGWFLMIDGDYPAFGRSYAKLGPREFEIAGSIALERLHALNWICDEEEDWDQVLCDT